VQLFRAAIDTHLEVTANAAAAFKTHAKRKTVKPEDVIAADQFLEKHGNSK
jgi:histone H3/H4